GWREIEDASEAADVMRALDREPPKGEVWEVSIEGSLWMAGEKSPPHPLFRILLCTAPNRDSCALQRVGVSARLVEHDRGARVLGEVCGVTRQVRNQHGRSARGVGRDRDQRGVGVAASAVNGRYSPREGAPQSARAEAAISDFAGNSKDL